MQSRQLALATSGNKLCSFNFISCSAFYRLYSKVASEVVKASCLPAEAQSRYNTSFPLSNITRIRSISHPSAHNNMNPGMLCYNLHSQSYYSVISSHPCISLSYSSASYLPEVSSQLNYVKFLNQMTRRHTRGRLPFATSPARMRNGIE